MPKFSLIRPLDQPLGRQRLLQELQTSLDDQRLSRFRLVVAYAKSGPLLRLRTQLETWRATGKRAEAIFGIDQQGTSKEALALALRLFDSVYVTRAKGITFHPKIYSFDGVDYAKVFIGSNNFTVHGTEKNFESAVGIEIDLPADENVRAAFADAWIELLPESCEATKKLDDQMLQDLLADGVVIPERLMQWHPSGGAAAGHRPAAALQHFAVSPESPLPRNAFPADEAVAATDAKSAQAIPGIAHRFVIQIKPQRNGEIRLSRAAIRQNRDFFGWPFTGRTTPKKPGNPSYPQRVPDPKVNIEVFDVGPVPILALRAFALNTVYL